MIQTPGGAPDAETVMRQQFDAADSRVGKQVAVMSLSRSEESRHACQQSFRPDAHIDRASRRPQRVDANHRNQFRTQAAQSREHFSGQLTVTLEAPRRTSIRISVEIAAVAACGNCTGKNSVSSPSRKMRNDCWHRHQEFGALA